MELLEWVMNATWPDPHGVPPYPRLLELGPHFSSYYRISYHKRFIRVVGKLQPCAPLPGRLRTHLFIMLIRFKLKYHIHTLTSEPKREELREGWCKLHNWKLHNFYSLLNVIRTNKSKRIGKVSGIGEMRNPQSIYVEKLKGRNHLRDICVDVRIILTNYLSCHYIFPLTFAFILNSHVRLGKIFGSKNQCIHIFMLYFHKIHLWLCLPNGSFASVFQNYNSVCIYLVIRATCPVLDNHWFDTIR